MTPLMLEILLHYHCRADDYRDGDFDAPAVRDGIAYLKQHGMLEAKVNGNMYRTTEKANFYIEQILSLPFPIQKWVMPHAAALREKQGFKPVGYLRSDEFDGHVFEPIDGTWPFDELLFSLSTSPEPEPVTLTDERLREIDDAHNWQTTEGRMAAYRAIIADAPAPAVPQGFKPVGYLRSDEFDGHVFEPIDGTWPFDELLFSLSTSPEPEPVTLTDGLIERGAMTGMVDVQIDAIIAALREKDGK